MVVAARCRGVGDNLHFGDVERRGHGFTGAFGDLDCDCSGGRPGDLCPDSCDLNVEFVLDPNTSGQRIDHGPCGLSRYRFRAFRRDHDGSVFDRVDDWAIAVLLITVRVNTALVPRYVDTVK